jgi:acetoacetyl-CoA reductase/3-oxoacyl-[acyl-carrier protein] reductase
MKGRVAIVTGGTRGIGAAVTELLSADGAHVAAVYAGNHQAARALQERLADRGSSVSVHAGDIGDPGFCRSLVAGLLEEHGRIDHLVNNAGLLVENNAFRMTDDEWDSALRINLAAMGSPVEVGYGAAKAGLVGLTRSLSRAVARKGITVNLVVPGIFETDMTLSMRPEAQEAIKAMIPMGRRGDPSELAWAVRFLVDDRASYVTGSVVTVDGGISMGD